MLSKRRPKVFTEASAIIDFSRAASGNFDIQFLQKGPNFEKRHHSPKGLLLEVDRKWKFGCNRK